MSASSKIEARLLSHEDQQLVSQTHHPAIYALTRAELQDMRTRLRGLRDRERTLFQQTVRESRGKAEPRGGSFPGVSEHPRKRKQVFAQALKRVNSEVTRIEHMAAHAAHKMAAHHALALRKSGEQYAGPANTPTPNLGVRPNPGRKRRTHIPGSQVGSVSQATKRAQAAKDKRSAAS